MVIALKQQVKNLSQLVHMLMHQARTLLRPAPIHLHLVRHQQPTVMALKQQVKNLSQLVHMLMHQARTLLRQAPILSQKTKDQAQ